MIETPMDVLRDFPVRNRKGQKRRFIEAVQSYARHLDYDTRVESEKMGVRNVVIGDPETARFLITAHYDTPAMLWCPNLIMPCNPFLNAICQIINCIILMLPAFAIGGGVWYATRDAGTAYLALTGAAVVSVLLMMFGLPNPRNANYNTSGVIALLEIAASMPANLRSRVCFVLFDREQVTMAGSRAYQKRHRAALSFQTVANLNCVGDGDTITFFPSKDLAEDVNLLCLERNCGSKLVKIHRSRRFKCVSDHSGFKRGVGVMALRRGLLGYWIAHTRTIFDKTLEYTNINILRACLISYISSHTAE